MPYKCLQFLAHCPQLLEARLRHQLLLPFDKFTPLTAMAARRSTPLLQFSTRRPDFLPLEVLE
jgi:hypothetical protein